MGFPWLGAWLFGFSPLELPPPHAVNSSTDKDIEIKILFIDHISVKFYFTLVFHLLYIWTLPLLYGVLKRVQVDFYLLSLLGSLKR